LLSHGDLLRQSLALVPRTEAEYRRELYEQALVYLARAERANPYRAMVFLIRGQLYQDNPEFAGEDWQRLTEEAYQEGLRLNPLLVKARLQYALFLAQQRNLEAAHRVLEAGVDYWYYLDANVVAYYDYTLALRRQLGKTEMAQELAPQVAKMKQNLASKIAEFVRAREQKTTSALSIPAYLKPGFWE
jgi:tetratricopeptide (TPR) repeat protein